MTESDTIDTSGALGVARSHVRERRLVDALHVLDRVLAVSPRDTAALVEKGIVHLTLNQPAAAEHVFAKTLLIDPELAPAWQGLGKALFDQCHTEGAIDAFDNAEAFDAVPALARYHRGMVLLRAGKWAKGWQDYESRLAVPAFGHRTFTQPRWDGKPLAGRRLLVLCEQGYGDVFQFVRYVTLLDRQDGKIIFECPADLAGLLKPVLGNANVVMLRGRGPPTSEFDCYVTLLSLPACLKTNLRTVPRDVPYLQTDAGKVAYWQKELTGPGLKVGIAWAGRPTHPQDAERSCDPEYLAPLAEIPGVTLYGLQKDKQHRDWLPGLGQFVTDLVPQIMSFDETAAVIANLDLVISVDTSIVHLAGAMARPVWVMLPYSPDWRWLLKHTDSPWYPTARLFRQREIGNWPGVISHVAKALNTLAKKTC